MSRHIVVTGASRGIGLELVAQALARGDRASALMRRRPAPMPAALEEAAVLHADVTRPESLAAAAADLAAPVDILVCNAGVYRGRGRIGDPVFGPDAWEETLMANIAGPYLTVEAFLPRLAEGARVAIVSSIMGSSARAPGGSYIYRASKAGATNLACNLAADLRERGIAVGSYHPGWVRTDMGGGSADIDAATSAAGLLARFDALSMETTGVFEDYAGEAIPF